MSSIRAEFGRLIRSSEINKLIKGGVAVALGSFVGGLLNYGYHLFLGRALGPENYGILSSLLSFSYVLSVPMGALSLLLTKLATNSQKNGPLLFWWKKQIIFGALAFLVVFVLFSPLMASFFHFSSLGYLFLLGLYLSSSLLVTFSGAMLRGNLKFLSLSLGGSLGVLLKLLLAIFLVNLGFGLASGLWALVFSSLFSFFFFDFSLKKSGPFLKVKFSKPKREIVPQKIGEEIFSFFLFSLSFTLLYNVDTIFARHFLSPREAGWYGSLSNLGKIIYFLTGAIVAVFFPMAVAKKSKRRSSDRLLGISLLIVLGIALFFTLLYFLIPHFVVAFFYGKAFLPAASYLGFFGIFLSFYSLSYLLGNYFLSQGEGKKVAVVALAVALLQSGLIAFFHQNISQIIGISLAANIFLFFLLWSYYLKLRWAEK